MHDQRRKPVRVGEDTVGWIGALATLIALFLLDSPRHPHKWHPAIAWTGEAFYVVALFGRTLWQSWRFWLLWTLFLIIHVFAMWIIFDKVLPAGHVWGTIYVTPPAFVEGILLVGLIARYNRHSSH